MKPVSLLDAKKGDIVDLIDPIFLGLQRPSVVMDQLIEERTRVCFDPWLIVKSQPNREAAAHASLVREGFECWYAAGRLMRRKPQRFISSKTRHKKKHVLIEDLRKPFPSYLFIRRMKRESHGFELHRLWELEGVLGLCMFGEQAAYAEHHEIQLQRFLEDIGAFDLWKVDMSAHDYGLATIERSEAAKERWEKPPKVVGTLDSNQGPRIHLIEAFGRITRVLAMDGPQLPGHSQVVGT